MPLQLHDMPHEMVAKIGGLLRSDSAENSMRAACTYFHTHTPRTNVHLQINTFTMRDPLEQEEHVAKLVRRYARMRNKIAFRITMRGMTEGRAPVLLRQFIGRFPEQQLVSLVLRLSVDYVAAGTAPDFVSQLTDLQHLDLKDCEVFAFPEHYLGNLSLKSLALGNGTRHDFQDDLLFNPFPRFVAGLRNLVKLDISHFFYGTKLVPDDEEDGEDPIPWAHLTALTHLNFAGNECQLIPPNITLLTNLQHLDLSDNRLESLEIDFAPFVHMTCLRITVHDWYDETAELHFDDSLCSLASLEHLDLNGLHLGSLPGNIGDLTRLVYLDISNSSLPEFPDSFTSLHRLETLYAENIECDSMPENIGRCTNLLRLNWAVNSLARIPESFVLLHKLRRVQLPREELIEEVVSGAVRMHCMYLLGSGCVFLHTE